MKSVGTLIARNKTIFDWRNIQLKERFRIACHLIFIGIVEIEWGGINVENIQ